MNRLLLAGWILFILLSVCTESFSGMIVSRTVAFHFQPYPDLSPFLDIDFTELTVPVALIQKIGHVFSFFVLTYLLLKQWGSIKSSAAGSFAFAFFTEVLQLFFSRNGCIRDVLIDTVGIVLFCGLYVLAKRRKLEMSEKYESRLS
ncbi:VanZ family protein [Bacillus sp. C28GYM-DRY-1]|uniref:VanZ family protein n=1 Tax=Bacillus sp. C28GYM-DRY-1 TaxID=3062686 RepID=UPI0026748D44|nr:VanZ family protein [Bacillus sp. C28GYM-DRY-1]MDO3659936.1 VanZ family protein [Bacillus sp. C28GYM-DRY-1]